MAWIKIKSASGEPEYIEANQCARVRGPDPAHPGAMALIDMAYTATQEVGEAPRDIAGRLKKASDKPWFEVKSPTGKPEWINSDHCGHVRGRDVASARGTRALIELESGLIAQVSETPDEVFNLLPSGNGEA
jgi:hypothetical protein